MQSLSSVRCALFADRFLTRSAPTSGDASTTGAHGCGRAVDLASGEIVWLREPAAMSRAEGEQWARRCARLCDALHPNLVDLVDFGVAGRGVPFEALRCTVPHVCWKARDIGTARALCSLVGFLHGMGCRAGDLSWAGVVDREGKPAWLPGAQTGLPLCEGDSRVTPGPAGQSVAREELTRLDRMIECCGAKGCSLRLPPPRSPGTGTPRASARVETLERLKEVLETGASAGLRRLAMTLPAGDEARLLLRHVAGMARRIGYVPLSTRTLEGSGAVAPEVIWDVMADRHVLLLHTLGDGATEESLALLLLRLGLSSARPHLVLSLRPVHSGRPYQLAMAAGKGRLARERPAPYLPRGQGADTVGPRTLPSGPWVPVTDQRGARARARAGEAGMLAAAGRHAAAERVLRETMGVLTRRGDGAGAGEAAMTLGRLLLLRGRPLEAAAQFEVARGHFALARLVPLATRGAVFIALARTDAWALDEAEAAARAAALAARETDDAANILLATLALARCLHWQGRADEGRAALEEVPAHQDDWAAGSRALRAAEAAPPFGVPGSPSGPDRPWSPGEVDPLTARACLIARLSLARGDVVSAGRAAAEARDRAVASGCPTGLAAACTALAGVHATLGDGTMLRQDVALGLQAARSARAPLRALRLRAVLAAGLTACGRGGEVTRLVSRLGRMDARRLPAVVWRPIERLLNGDLAPYVPPGPVPVALRRLSPAPAGGPAAAPLEVVEGIVEILGLSQDGQSDEAVLQSVIRALSRRHRVTALVCLGREDGASIPLAADGRDPMPEAIGRRAMDLAQAVPPTSSSSGSDAGVPIRFAGEVIGALACRWPADVRPDWARAGASLAAAAAALAPCVRAALDRRATEAAAQGGGDEEIVGSSEIVAALRQQIARAAAAPFSVIIEGESGSGKELVARAIHRLGPRGRRRLCALNCAALSDELFESELFGHARGAFTGAVTDRRGLFEEADGGSLVLDEVGELTPRAQARLLRVIQEGEVRRVGENFTRPVDVRLICATNRSLRAAAEAGLFRRDLLYRLDVIRLVVPPLRERAEDIPALAAHFWRLSTSRLGSHATLAPATVAALARYDWPGNVRELQNVLAALAVQAGRRCSVGPASLPPALAGSAGEQAVTLEQARTRFEARYVRAALARAGGQRAQTARNLGLSRQGFTKLLARLGIED